MQSVIPRFSSFNHCIQNGQEFAHTRNENHLFRLTRVQQSEDVLVDEIIQSPLLH